MDKDKLPRHVAIIMDGNGRWAEREGVSRIKGHTAGMEAMKEIVRKSSHMGIQYLTVYAFSTENWKRTMEEVSGIFKLLVKFVKLDLSELDEENVKVRVSQQHCRQSKIRRDRRRDHRRNDIKIAVYR